MSKFKKRLKRAAKVGLDLAAVYALTKSKMDMGVFNDVISVYYDVSRIFT